jgi:hypothetical protein
MCAGFFLPLALYGPTNTVILSQVPVLRLTRLPAPSGRQIRGEESPDLLKWMTDGARCMVEDHVACADEIARPTKLRFRCRGFGRCTSASPWCKQT